MTTDYWLHLLLTLNIKGRGRSADGVCRVDQDPHFKGQGAVQGGAGRGKVATSMIIVIVFATISVQSGGEDGWIPRVDQQASTSPKQTVSTATSGCLVVFPSWLVSQLDCALMVGWSVTWLDQRRERMCCVLGGN